MKNFMVLKSHDQLRNTDVKTNLWLEELAPCCVYRDIGADATLASLKGGQPPIDPKSDLPENQTPAMARLKRVQDLVAAEHWCSSAFACAGGSR